MNVDSNSIKAAVRGKVIELAKNLGIDASNIGDDDIVPATGYIDSAAVMELIVWYDDAFGMALKQEEINIDNLGSINAMTEFVIKRRSG